MYRAKSSLYKILGTQNAGTEICTYIWLSQEKRVHCKVLGIVRFLPNSWNE